MKKNSPTSLVLSFFTLLWVVLSAALYIFFPARISYINSIDLGSASISPELLKAFLSAEHWGNFAFAFFGVMLFSFAFISTGNALSGLLKLDYAKNSTSFLEQLANLGNYFILGNILYSSIFLVLAGFYKITPGIVAALLIGGMIFGAPQFLGGLKNIMSIHKANTIGREKTLWLAFIALGTTLFSSAARISYDSSAIYFSNAKFTAYTGQINFFSNDTFVASAFQNTIQFTALIQLFGDQSARMFSWVCGILIIIFSLALGEKVGLSRFGRIIVLALIMTSTAFVDLLGDGKIDLISTLPAIATVYWIISQSQKESQNSTVYIFIGILAGTSITSRPFNAFLLGIFVTLFYFNRQILEKKQGFAAFFTTMTWIGVGVGIAGVFHLFINWMIYRDVFAFLNSLSNINSASGPWDNDPDIILALRLLYPFVVTFRNTPQSLGNISPLVIILLPALFSRKIRGDTRFSADLKLLSTISVITLILWITLFFTVVEIRYVLFLWIILFMLTAQLMESYVETLDLILKKVITGLPGFLLIFMVIRTGLISLATYSPINKEESPQCSNFGLCDYFSEINRTAAPGDRVLTLTAFRYYFRNDLFVCSTSSNEYSVLKKLSYQSLELFWEEVYRQGYSYIAYESDYTARHLQFNLIPDPENTPEWLKLERIDKYDTDVVAAYKIIILRPPFETISECQLNDQNIWKVTIDP